MFRYAMTIHRTTRLMIGSQTQRGDLTTLYQKKCKLSVTSVLCACPVLLMPYRREIGKAYGAVDHNGIYARYVNVCSRLWDQCSKVTIEEQESSHMTRIEIITECEHGNYRCSEIVEWPMDSAVNANDFIPHPCSSGSRVVLTGPTDEMVEAGTKGMYQRIAEGIEEYSEAEEPWDWDTEIDTIKDIMRADVHAALDAAFAVLVA